MPTIPRRSRRQRGSPCARRPCHLLLAGGQADAGPHLPYRSSDAPSLASRQAHDVRPTTPLFCHNDERSGPGWTSFPEDRRQHRAKWPATLTGAQPPVARTQPGRVSAGLRALFRDRTPVAGHQRRYVIVAARSHWVVRSSQNPAYRGDALTGSRARGPLCVLAQGHGSVAASAQARLGGELAVCVTSCGPAGIPGRHGRQPVRRDGGISRRPIRRPCSLRGQRIPSI